MDKEHFDRVMVLTRTNDKTKRILNTILVEEVEESVVSKKEKLPIPQVKILLANFRAWERDYHDLVDEIGETGYQKKVTELTDFRISRIK